MSPKPNLVGPLFGLALIMVAAHGFLHWDAGNSFHHDEEGRLLALADLAVIAALVAALAYFHRQSKRALDEREQRYRQLFESARDAVATTDMSGRIVDCNAAFLHLTGYQNLRELSLLTYQDITPPEYRDKENELLSTQLMTRGYTDEYEKQYLRKDGTRVDVSLRVVLRQDTNNRPTEMWAWIRDITERKNADQALRLERNRLRTLIDSTPDLIFFKDLDGVYQNCNRAFALRYETDEARIIGKKAADFLTEETARRSDEHDARVIAERKPIAEELTIRFPDGSVLDVDTVKTPVFGSDGRPVGLVAYAHDITERKRVLKALRESEERWKFALEGAGDGVWDWNIETGRIEYSSRFKEMLGYPPETPWERVDDWKDLVIPEDLSNAMVALEAYFDGRRNDYAVEYRMRCRDGDIKWIQARGKATFDDDGRPLRMIGTHTDITDRKLAEDKLRRNEEDLRLLLESVAEAIFGIDLDGKITFCNPAALRLLGYLVPEQLIGRDMHTLIHHSREDGSPRARRSSPILSALADDSRAHCDNDIFWRSDFTCFPVEYWSHPQFRDGRVIGAVVTFFDISARVTANERLHKLSRAVENSPASVIITNLDGDIEYVNRKFTEVSGYTPAEAIGNNPRIMNSGLHDATFYRELWDTILSGQEWHGELHNRRKNGEIVIESTSISPIRDEAGAVTHFVAIKEDVTERIRIANELKQSKEQAEAANRAKSDFLANMSHEIRTPMNAIIGLSHLCLQTNLSVVQHDYVRKVYNAATSLLRIINDILDVSKIEAGRMELERVPFNLAEIAGNVLAMFSAKAREKGLAFQIDTAPDVPLELLGDPLRLEQILINLIGNAIKFTASGSIRVRISLRQTDTDHVALRFDVRDTGIGMTADQVGKLFSPFTQADTSITRNYGGTGLGLVICKRLIDLMEGEVEVTSAAGAGSNFGFTARFGRLREAPPRLLVEIPDLRGLRVLVVDDDENSRLILDQYLRSFDFDVTGVGDGTEALEHIELEQTTHPYGLLIIDWKLPTLDGIATAKVIRSQTRLQPAPRLMLISSHTAAEMAAAAEPGLFDAILEKPFDQSSLLESIMHLFSSGDAMNDASRRQVRHIPETLGKIRGAHLLLVEDDEVNMLVARDLLRLAEISVTVAENGAEALSHLANEKFDGILMDIHMPIMDGLTATRTIRADPVFADLPIIAMTANAMPADRRRCIEAGMNDHVAKPVDPYRLYAVLATWIKPAATGRVQTQRAEPANDDEALPDIPGVDVSESLQRMGGNLDTYYIVLEKFLRNQSASVESMRAALKRNDTAELRRLLHTLGSVAGTLGAKALHHHARKLEIGLNQSAIAWDTELVALEVELASVCERIRTALTARRVVRPIRPQSQVVSCDAAHIGALLNKTRQRLERFDTAVEESVAALRNALPPGHAAEHPLGALEACLHRYDYEAAMIELHHCAEAFDISLGDST